MATRSPTPFHSFWGAVTLPAPLPAGADVQTGDTVYSTDTGLLYVASTNGPTPTWVPVGGGAPSLSEQVLTLNGTSTGGAVAYIGAVYLPAITTLAVTATAYIGGSLVGDTTVLSLVPIAGGPAVAAWTRTGTLGTQPLAASVAGIPAGWYDLTLQGTAGSGVAFARGLYLA